MTALSLQVWRHFTAEVEVDLSLIDNGLLFWFVGCFVDLLVALLALLSTVLWTSTPSIIPSSPRSSGIALSGLLLSARLCSWAAQRGGCPIPETLLLSGFAQPLQLLHSARVGFELRSCGFGYSGVSWCLIEFVYTTAALNSLARNSRAVQQEKPAPQRRVLRRSHCCSVIDVDVASHQMHGLKKYNATKFSFAQTGMNMVHPLSNRFAATSLLNNDSFAATSLSNNYSFAATSLSNNPFQDRYIVNAGTACWLGHRTRDRKVASWNPGRSSGRIFFSRVIFVCWLLFGVRSTPILPQWYVKDPGHSAQSAGGRCWLHLNTHTPLIQQRRSGLTTLLSRHSVGTYQETSQPQSSQPAEPLWTEPGMKSGISVRELISTSKKKVLAGND